MAYDGSLIFDTKINTDGFQQDANQLTNLVKGLGIFEVIKKGAQLVTDSIGNAVGRIDTMEQFSRVMDTITGSSEKASKALAATKDIVTGTAYGLDVAAKSVQNFVSRGMEVDSATETVERFGDAVAFYGDGTNATFASVTDALSKMQTKGTVTMEHLEMLFNAGIPAVEIYASAMGISSQDVTDAMSKGELSTEDFISTLNRAFAEGAKGFPSLAGAAKKAGASWKGTFDNMKAAVTRGVQSIINAIDDTLLALKQTDMRTIVSKFGKAFESALNAVAKAIPPVIKAIDMLSPAIVAIAVGVEAYTLVVKAAAAAQAIWTALMAITLNPVALVVAGVAAAATGIVLLNQKLSQGGTELDYWNERNAEAVAALDEHRQKTEALRQAREDSLATDFAQIDNTQRLANELYGLVDADGAVQEVSRARVNFILGELNSAYGTEYQMIDGVIQQYDKLHGSINSLAEAKRASVMLDSWSEEYTDAVNSIDAMRDVVSEHRTNLDTIQADMDAFATKYPEAYNAFLKAQAAYGDGSDALREYMEKSAEEGWAYFYKEYEQKKSAMDAEQKLHDDALVQLNGYHITRDGYERASIAMQQGNYQEVARILTDESFVYAQEAENLCLSEEEKTQALAENYANRLAAYAQYAQELHDGEVGRNAQELETIRAQAAQAQEAYSAMGAAMVNGKIQGIDGKALDLQASFSRLEAVGITSLTDSIPEYTAAASQIPQAIEAGMQASATLPDSTAQMVADTKAATDAAVAENNFADSGTQIATQTASGVETSTAVNTAAQSAVTGAKSAATAQVTTSNFSSVGLQMTKDIVTGINSGAVNIASAIQSAIGAANTQAGQGSNAGAPSSAPRGSTPAPAPPTAPRGRVSPAMASSYSLSAAMDGAIEMAKSYPPLQIAPMQAADVVARMQSGVAANQARMAYLSATHTPGYTAAPPAPATKSIQFGDVILHASPGASESEMSRVLEDYETRADWGIK